MIWWMQPSDSSCWKSKAMVIGTCDVWGLIDCVIGNDPVGVAIRQNLLGTLSKKRKAMVIGTCGVCGLIDCVIGN